MQEGKSILILTRRVGETLIINDDIKVTVIGVKGNQVRLGIEAPDDVSIHREEIHERLKSEDKTYTDEHQKKLNGEGNE